MPDSNNNIIIALRPSANYGQEILTNRWLPFIESLRELLTKIANEREKSSDNLLLFSCRDVLNATSSIIQGFNEIKNQYNWETNSGSLPLKVLMDLERPDDTCKICDPAAPCWDSLHQESIYLTSGLYKKWNDFISDRKVPDYNLKDTGNGYFRLSLGNASQAHENLLFPCRDLPTRGKETECFYCAMQNHTPANCPSKFLNIRNKGLGLVGSLSFSRLNDIYQKIFADMEVMNARLAEGIRPTEFNKNDELQVYVAYLDIYRIFQPRFLDLIAFTLFSKWDTMEKTEIRVDSRNLYMALDCLRVGKYKQAEELFDNERTKKNGKLFSATMGMAFLSLEKNRLIEMEHYLKKAASVAIMEKERFYSRMLLSRLYEIKGDFWAAKEEVGRAEKILPFQGEVQLRKLQLEARTGLNDKDMKTLHDLMVDWKEMYMAILMDPHLLPVQGAVEVFASEIYYNIGQEAKNNLLGLKAEFDQMQLWLPPDDQQIKDKNEIMLSLKKKFQQKGYYDLLEVADRSASLTLTWKNIRLEKLRQLKLRIKKMEQEWDRNSFLWKSYAYKYFFKEFGEKLPDCKKTLNRINKLLKKEKVEDIRQGISLVEEAELITEELHKDYDKMIMMITLINSCKTFSKNLLLSEICLVTASGILLFLASSLSDHPKLGWIAKMGILTVRSTQYKVAAFIIFVLAPLVAILLTVNKLQKS